MLINFEQTYLEPENATCLSLTKNLESLYPHPFHLRSVCLENKYKQIKKNYFGNDLLF